MNPSVNAILLFVITAFAEIIGCYSFHLFFVLKKSPLWLLPGLASLAVFAWLLTLHPTVAGRTYAAYGGIYIAASLVWLKWVDGHDPDRWDLIGATICICGAAMILVPHLRQVTAN